jgi:GntR family transcriptional regulator / MocR family aminotransferase
MNVSEADLSPAPLERGRKTTLTEQICARFRKVIDGGVLRPGDRVASARILAAELGVSRGTIEAAYGRLAGEGYLVPRGQAGTLVSLDLRPHPSAKQNSRELSSIDRVGRHTKGAPPALQLGIPALDAFPRKLWARIVSRCVNATSTQELSYGEPRGSLALRDALASYLQVSRGVACRPEQIFVTSGYRSSLALISQALLEPGDSVWVEDPGYAPTR